MIIVKAQELKKWTDIQAIVVNTNDDIFTVAASGPITAAAGAYKYVTAFGLEVDRVKVSKVNKHRWQINLS